MNPNDSDSQSCKKDDQQFVAKQNKPKSKQQQKKQPKKVAGKKKKDEEKKPPKKKKEKSKSKGKTANNDVLVEEVFEYLQKMNRPYNLLNVFDNLHGSIKKPVLQEILETIVDQKRLVSKQFGKNKVYFINQERYNVNTEQIQKLGSKLSDLRQVCSQLQDQYKMKSQQYKGIISKKTYNQMLVERESLKANNDMMKIKLDRLKGEVGEKVEKQVVEKIQKQEKDLRKQLVKRKKITKECINIWSEILQKKIPETAQIMGVEL